MRQPGGNNVTNTHVPVTLLRLLVGESCEAFDGAVFCGETEVRSSPIRGARFFSTERNHTPINARRPKIGCRAFCVLGQFWQVAFFFGEQVGFVLCAFWWSWDYNVK